MMLRENSCAADSMPTAQARKPTTHVNGTRRDRGPNECAESWAVAVYRTRIVTLFEYADTPTAL